MPDVEGKEHAIVSDDVFDLPVFPKRMLIVGGGYIASEFASIFNGLGTEVTLLIRKNLLLSGFDEDVRKFVTEQMVHSGINLKTEANVTKIEKKGDVFICHLDNGESVETDLVFYATGRNPRTDGLNLDKAGVELTEKGAIKVDDNYKTTADSVFAIGDVIDRLALTPVALNEGMVVSDYLFGDKKRSLSYQYIATAVFTHPNIGTVGYSEKDAREKFGDIEIYQSVFTPLKHTLSGSGSKMLVKIIVDKATDVVVGIHIVGDDSGEIIQGFAVAVKAGLTKAQFDATVAIHPTSAEEIVTLREPVR